MDTTTYPPTLTIGSCGPAVRKWQTVLRHVPAHGVFDAVTETATKIWQHAHGLPATGIVDGGTWSTWLAITERPTEPDLSEAADR